MKPSKRQFIGWKSVDWPVNGQQQAGISFATITSTISGMTMYEYIGALINNYHGEISTIWLNDVIIWTKDKGWEDIVVAINVSDAWPKNDDWIQDKEND